MIGRLKDFRCLIPALILPILAVCATASEGLDIPEALEHKVSLEGLSGINLFFATMYNENMLLYAVICTVLMAAIGVIIAFVTDAILKACGVETEKLQHRE